MELNGFFVAQMNIFFPSTYNLSSSRDEQQRREHYGRVEGIFSTRVRRLTRY